MISFLVEAQRLPESKRPKASKLFKTDYWNEIISLKCDHLIGHLSKWVS